MNLKMKILTIEDVKQLLTMKDAIELIEAAFLEKGLKRVQMPPKSYLFFKKYNGDLRIMPSYLERLDEVGVKLVNVHPDNPKKHGLPTVIGTIVLFDPKTGAPLCIMDGTWITAMRTAAATGVATKYLARKDVKTVGLIGAGYQAPFQLEALCEVMEVELVKVYARRKERVEKFAEEMEAKLELDVEAMDTAEDAVKGADVLVTVTPSRAPVVKDEWVVEGMHINGVGADAPGKQELDPRILKRAKIIVDDWEQACHSGEVNVPLSRGEIVKEDIYCELGEVVAGLRPGRTSEGEITIFDSTGLSIHDVITGWHVLRMAEQRDMGKEVPALYI
jgi:alanine dehydrogenase